ncbi:holo-acyl-carrier-protein synthase [Dehalogenimonas lykanthroporepellens BL-DC-9]|nr:holo-acyl-carrier-protein synthase [Dehalogenimonas lykanthroporepellens BL-DC-9]
MKQHLGIDIIEISRVKEAATRWGDRFLERVFTAEELRRYRHRPASLSARFAAKEAVVKALDIREMIYRDIEITADDSGRPTVTLYGRARSRADELGLTDLTVSLSHSRDYAVAVVSGIV